MSGLTVQCELILPVKPIPGQFFLSLDHVSFVTVALTYHALSLLPSPELALQIAS